MTTSHTHFKLTTGVFPYSGYH